MEIVSVPAVMCSSRTESAILNHVRAREHATRLSPTFRLTRISASVLRIDSGGECIGMSGLPESRSAFGLRRLRVLLFTELVV